jgi:hypothetical protein
LEEEKMITEIIAIDAITDDLLQAIGHHEDCRVQLSDAEVLTTALVAARFLSGKQQLAQHDLKKHGFMPQMLDQSRCNRRLHRLFLPRLDLFDSLGTVLKAIQPTTAYLLDSFAVPIWDNMRLPRVRLVRSEDDRGDMASKKRYFYGIRVQRLCTETGIPVECVFLPGEANDTRGVSALPLHLPAGSQVYADAGYTDYQAEEALP